MPEDITIDQLRGLIGERVSFREIQCCVIELLEDEPALVLQDREEHTVIQDNQYGEPHRRVACTYTVPVLSRDRHSLHPDFLAMELLGDEC